MQPAGQHLAKLNIGRLLAPTDGSRVAEFMNALYRVNGLDKRTPGFVWMMEGSGEPGTGNTPMSNLTVGENVETLENFVWNTVHRAFMNAGRAGLMSWEKSISWCGACPSVTNPHWKRRWQSWL